MRTAPFWDTVQCVPVIPHLHFETNDRSHVKGSRIQRMDLWFLTL